MALPVGWPPRPASGRRSIRFFVSGTASANWEDNAYLFIDDVGANTFQPTPFVPAGGVAVAAAVGTRTNPGSPMGAGAQLKDVIPGDLGLPKPLIWASSIRVYNDGLVDLEISFGALNNASTLVQGVIKSGHEALFRDRYEAGIALRSPGGTAAFRVEAW